MALLDCEKTTKALLAPLVFLRPAGMALLFSSGPYFFRFCWFLFFLLSRYAAPWTYVAVLFFVRCFFFSRGRGSTVAAV